MTAIMTRAPVISISHGGGPLPIMNHPGHTHLIDSLKTKVPQILKLGTSEAPRAIVVITAHWEERTPTISGAAKHSLYYDYYGFPPETYDLKYDAPGSPEIAKEVCDVFEKAGLKPAMDNDRGWDHGVFIPFMLINPAANIPLIQISVLPAHAESPSGLYAMGRALSQLRDSNIAIVGSGLATNHNMRLLQSGPPSARTKEQIAAFSKALTEAVLIKDVDVRGKALEAWRGLPNADLAHLPRRAEHLFPLFVCAGAGGEGEAKKWTDQTMGFALVSYYWD
jgi:aromatic ring-opening dioxygenase catalytic subunit (LigB family)